MSNVSTKERCVMCSDLTDYDITTHIDLRHGYIEGMGQLCYSCYTGSTRKSFLIDQRTVMETPNDMELGSKVRRIFYESHGIPMPEDVGWERIQIR